MARSPVPDGFQTSWVLRCREESRTTPADGTWTVMIEERADGPAIDLVASLRTPSDKASGEPVCPAIGYFVPYFVLVDGAGRGVLADVPTKVCGEPKSEALAALDKLPFRVVRETRVRQVESSGSIAAGCAMHWKDMLEIQTDDGSARPAPAHRLWPVFSFQLKICIYRAGADPTDGGTFESGRTIADPYLAGIVPKLDAAPPASPCTASHTRYAVLLPATGEPAYAELDGCRRLLRPDSTLGQLDAAVIGLVA